MSPEGVLEEARYFGFESLLPRLEQLVAHESLPRDEQPLTRRDVVNALLGTSAGGRPEDRLGQELRFQVRSPKVPILKELKHQGTNLSGADLSRLDLRHINFK